MPDLDSLNYNVDYTSSRILLNNTICCIVTAVVTVVIICLNSVTVLAYWKSTQLCKKMTNFLILILSLNDLAVGLIAGPLCILFLVEEITLKGATDVIANLNLGSSLLFSGMSFETMIVMNCERYLGTVHPMFHLAKVTKERLLQYLLAIWAVGGAQIILLFFYGDFFVKLKTAEVMFCMLLLLFMYVQIYLTAQESRNLSLCCKSKNRVHQEEASYFKVKSLITNVKLAKSCLLVIVCAFVCFIPAPLTAGAIDSTNEVAYMVQIWSETFILLNSSLNSIIFFWRNSCLRKEALIIIRCAIKQ